MNTEKTYNGWRNYETWCANLWLTNDAGSVDHYAERARELLLEKDFFEDSEEAAHDAACEFARELESELQDGMPELGASLYADLLQSALDTVDHYEIAKHFIEDEAEAIKQTLRNVEVSIQDVDDFRYAKPDTWQAELMRGTSEDDESAPVEANALKGFYWWNCQPGCLPDSDAYGPFYTKAEAFADAYEHNS